MRAKQVSQGVGAVCTDSMQSQLTNVLAFLTTTSFFFYRVKLGHTQSVHFAVSNYYKFCLSGKTWTRTLHTYTTRVRIRTHTKKKLGGYVASRARTRTSQILKKD